MAKNKNKRNKKVRQKALRQKAHSNMMVEHQSRKYLMEMMKMFEQQNKNNDVDNGDEE